MAQEFITRRAAHRAGFWEGFIYGAFAAAVTVAAYCYHWYN